MTTHRATFHRKAPVHIDDLGNRFGAAIAQILTRRGLQVSTGLKAGAESLLTSQDDVVPVIDDEAIGDKTLVVAAPENTGRYSSHHCIDYGQALEQLLRERLVLGIWGTHGTGSVTAMMSWVLQEAGHCVGVISRREQQLPANPCEKGEEIWIVELGIDQATAAALHCDFVVGTFLDLAQSQNEEMGIEEVVHLLRSNACLKEAFINLECRGNREVVRRADLRPTGYSLAHRTEFQGEITSGDASPICLHLTHRERPLMDLSVPLRGRHQGLNAVAVATICHRMGLAKECIVEGLESFPGLSSTPQAISAAGARFMLETPPQPAALGPAAQILRENDHHPIVAVIDPAEGSLRQWVKALQEFDQVILTGSEAAPLASLMRSNGQELKVLNSPRLLEDQLTDAITPQTGVVFVGGEWLMASADQIIARVAQRGEKSEPPREQPGLQGPLTQGDDHA